MKRNNGLSSEMIVVDAINTTTRCSAILESQCSHPYSFNRCRTRIIVRKVGDTSSSPWTVQSPSSSSTVRSSTQRTHTVLLRLRRHRRRLIKRRRNTVTLPVVDDLVAAYELFDLDDRVRAVVLTADPTADAFCAGVRLFCVVLVVMALMRRPFFPLSSTAGGYLGWLGEALFRRRRAAGSA
jgi:hypothetical protein